MSAASRAARKYWASEPPRDILPEIAVASRFTLLPVTSELRSQMGVGVSVDTLERTAINDGMVPLTARAMELARDGITSLEEVYRTRLE